MSELRLRVLERLNPLAAEFLDNHLKDQTSDQMMNSVGSLWS